MRIISRIAMAIACVAVLGQTSVTMAQSQAQGSAKKGSTQKATMQEGSAKKESMMAKETISRAFTNGFNVPSSGVALEGYCPVCYISAGKAAKGTPEFAYDYKGVTYWFVHDGARQTFAAAPEKYLPAYGGWCAVGVAMGQRFPVDPTNFKVVNGKTMLFLKNAKIDGVGIWNKDEASMYTKAEENWKKLGSM